MVMETEKILTPNKAMVLDYRFMKQMTKILNLMPVCTLKFPFSHSSKMWQLLSSSIFMFFVFILKGMRMGGDIYLLLYLHKGILNSDFFTQYVHFPSSDLAMRNKCLSVRSLV